MGCWMYADDVVVGKEEVIRRNVARFKISATLWAGRRPHILFGGNRK